MTGKIINKDGKPYLLTYIGYLPVSPTNPNEVLNKIEDRLKEESYIWVEFIVDTIAIGSNEFDVIDCDVALIEKIYSEDFGTSKELVSDAFFRYENKNYPIGGFSPGQENRICSNCKKDFIGDISSDECELCSLNKLLKNGKN